MDATNDAAKADHGQVRNLIMTRVFDAPLALVWKAWSDPDYIKQWWGPKYLSLIHISEPTRPY